VGQKKVGANFCSSKCADEKLKPRNFGQSTPKRLHQPTQATSSNTHARAVHATHDGRVRNHDERRVEIARDGHCVGLNSLRQHLLSIQAWLRSS